MMHASGQIEFKVLGKFRQDLGSVIKDNQGE